MRPSPDATISPSPHPAAPSASGGNPFPPFQQQSPTTDERLTSLENSLSQLLSVLQQGPQTLQPLQQQIQQGSTAATPDSARSTAATSNSAGSTAATPPSQLLQLQPPPLPTGLPPAITSLPQGSVFVPPISLNPASGMSIDRSFPHVESALRLAISKHEFRPSHLYKLDATVKEHPKPKAFEISDDGEFLQCERDASPKDYPSFRALYDPLVVYFQILQYFVIASSNTTAIHQVVFGCSEYLRILYQIYMRYEWSAVLQYHLCSIVAV
ncbi:hypothetical protein JB92DRAFT_2832167 [Gautieria morchelliformis]|nr:hypothetical protein JB92DRAFT_2832167 [Gautieria morchelliformis]